MLHRPEQPAVQPADEVSRYLHLLRCPACGGTLALRPGALDCGHCAGMYPVEGRLPLLFHEDESKTATPAVTAKIRSFYEEHPFPDYEDSDDLGRLMDKARRGVFARLLDEQIPFGVRVLDCGCGTGQLANFLGIAHRTVFGTDLSLASLRLAQEFKQEHDLERVHFLQMNLFFPVFPHSSFDVIISNGVLHHTANPYLGFQMLARLVKPGGFLVVGLYHRWGRLLNDFRRGLFRLGGRRLSFLDPYLRNKDLSERRKSAWFADQYRNPHELKVTIGEVLDWLEPNGLTLVKSIPKTDPFRSFSPNERLFEPETRAPRWKTRLRDWSMTVGGTSEGGFFTIIARKDP
jgi:SAM-dependent methyltransferase